LAVGDRGPPGSEFPVGGGADQDLKREVALGTGRDPGRIDSCARFPEAVEDRPLAIRGHGVERDHHRGADQAGDRREIFHIHVVLTQNPTVVLVDHATDDPDHGLLLDGVVDHAIFPVNLEPCAALDEDLAPLQFLLEGLADPRRGIGGQPCRSGKLIESDRRLAFGVEALLDPFGQLPHRDVQVVPASRGGR